LPALVRKNATIESDDDLDGIELPDELVRENSRRG
jgi:hypothetical protein